MDALKTNYAFVEASTRALRTKGKKPLAADLLLPGVAVYLSCPAEASFTTFLKSAAIAMLKLLPHCLLQLFLGFILTIYYFSPDINELELKLSEHSKKLSSLQLMVQELASKYDYSPDEEYAETELKLRSHLESFLETVRSFNLIYTKEIRPWTNMMEVPQLHGFGPAANRLLEAYNTLLKVFLELSFSACQNVYF
ncbi:AUGMIN subunit 7-like [Phalaenopsis equestris]|uniref:AUGMIN subunit 7-like n=1 Tax=Phalaenopsis equestris TaxID=78828 RepID=UPI0009E5D2ED|nr:AUGMIN subunit 7-like [Phalaenopsis equestris]